MTTYRETLLSMQVGESHDFGDVRRASSASACACKLYAGRTYSRNGSVLTRTDKLVDEEEPPVFCTNSVYRMNTRQFNRMLRSANAMLANHNSGAEIDPESIAWARALTAANPSEKRFAAPTRDAVLALFDGHPERRATGLLVGDINVLIDHGSRNGLASALHYMTRQEPPTMWALKTGSWCRYFPTAEDRDAYAAAREAEAEARQGEIAQERHRRQAEVRAAREARNQERARVAQEKRAAESEERAAERAERRAAAKLAARSAKVATPKPAKQPKTGAEMLLRAAKLRRVRGRVNPDQGGPWAPKPKIEVPSPVIAPDDPRIQRGPSYTHDPRFQVAPGERPFGAGFSATPIGHNPSTGLPW